MKKVVNSDIEWERKRSLYYNYKYGYRKLQDVYDIIVSKNNKE